MQPGEFRFYVALWLFHNTCVGTDIWRAYDEDIEMKNLPSLCRILAEILWGYKQSHDSIQDESNLGDDSNVDES